MASTSPLLSPFESLFGVAGSSGAFGADEFVAFGAEVLSERLWPRDSTGRKRAMKPASTPVRIFN